VILRAVNLTVYTLKIIAQLSVLSGGILNLQLGFTHTHLLVTTTSTIALLVVIYYSTQVNSLHSSARLGLANEVRDSDHRARQLFMLVALGLFLEAEYAP
jgi:hypothetical protein